MEIWEIAIGLVVLFIIGWLLWSINEDIEKERKKWR